MRILNNLFSSNNYFKKPRNLCYELDQKVSSIFSGIRQTLLCAHVPKEEESIPLKEFSSKKSSYLNLLEKNTLLLSKDLSLVELDLVRDIYEKLEKSESLDQINEFVQLLLENRDQFISRAQKAGSFVVKRHNNIKLLRPIIVNKTSVVPVYKKHKPGLENEGKKGKDQPIGKGTEAVIWPAGEKHVVKRMYYHDLDREEIEDHTNDLKREAKYLKKLYPELDIEIVDHDGKHGSRILLKMPRMNSFSEESGRTPEQILDIIEQMTNILLLLKENNIVHRDIKPENLLMKDEKLYLFDFGVADKEIPEGTPLFMAPETISTLLQDRNAREKPAFSMDMYATGIFLISLIYQTHPFIETFNRSTEFFLEMSGVKLKMFEKQNKKDIWIDEKLKLTDQQSKRKIQEMIRKMMHLDPQQRLSPEEMLRMLKHHKEEFKQEIQKIQLELLAQSEEKSSRKKQRVSPPSISAIEEMGELNSTVVIT